MRLLLIFFLFKFSKGQQILDLSSVFRDAKSLGIGNAKCQEQLKQFNLKEEWSLKMIDASSKLQSGILAGNVFDFGHFDECLSIEHDYTLSDGTKGKILGQHCAASLIEVIPQFSSFANFNKTSKSFLNQQITRDDKKVIATKNAICIPDACVPSDFSKVVEKIPFIFFNDGICQTKEHDTDIDGYAIFAIVFFSIIGACMIISTVYDVYLYKTEKKASNILFLAFSVFSNGKKLVHITKSTNQIHCLHGIRVISMMWIIMGHVGATAQAFIATNAAELMTMFKETWSQFIQGGHLGVDTFLFLTGFLLTNSFLRTNSKPGAKFNIIMYYIHRYLRLTPALLGVYVFIIGLYRYFINIPVGPAMTKMMVQPCKDWWWSVFLYVQNYVNMHEVCLTPSWYISMDMQIFILTPFVLLPLVKFPKIGFCNLLAVLGISVAIPAVVCYYYETEMFKQDYYDYYYYLTHTRLAPYVMGIFFGYYIHKTDNKKVSIHWIVNWTLWTISLAGMATCVFTGADVIYNYDRVETAVYLTLLRPAWTLGLIWIVFSCMKGHGGIINWLLSLSMFQFMSKLTYSMYLWHSVIINIFNKMITKSTTYVNRSEMVFQFWGYFVITFVVSLVAVLAFESPIIIIEKIIFGKGAPRNKPKEKTEEPKSDVEAQNGDTK